MDYIVSAVVEKLAEQLIDEAVSLSRVREQFEWIQGELKRMQCFLEDADIKQHNDARVKKWVADIRDIAYETEDIIDTYILKMHKKRKRSLTVILKNYGLFFNELIDCHKASKRIDTLRRKLHDITESRATYRIGELGRWEEETSARIQLFKERRKSSSQICEEDIIGLEEDREMLEAQLICGEARRPVISITGMAGLGKTTLAKSIYHSSRVREQFDCYSWICISQEYRMKETLRELGKKLMGLGKQDLEMMSCGDLKEVLSNFLEKRRYIIVLDDIWKKEVWDDLKAAFPDRKNGSRIIFTTRFKDVALHADPGTLPHELHLLDDEDSWKLFLKKACIEWNASKTSLPPWCEELGKGILKKCEGLPLAIVVLGGLLSRKEATYGEWLKVLQSVHWQLNHEPKQCADIFALSYSDLPHYLKPCFLYFGLFPEDFEICARRLVLLWIAEGFVQPRGEEALEDVAEDYLEELVARSVVQVAARKSNGRIKVCRIHDLLREFSISKAKEDQFLEIIHEDVEDGSLKRARRLAVCHGIPLRTDIYISKVRSLLCFDLSEPIFNDVKRFKLLRVLDFEGVHISKLHTSVGKLVHLRYLGLRRTFLKSLCPSIGDLTNLQTLDLRSTLISYIPTSIFKLKHLQHLYSTELKEVTLTSSGDASLAQLHTLGGLYIGKTSCIENGLDKLTNLRELGLQGYLNTQEGLGTWIYELKLLHCLKLQGSSNLNGDYRVVIPEFRPFSSHIYLYKMHLKGSIMKLLNVQDFPPNLTELTLAGSFLMEDPMEKLEKLPCLRLLKLKQSSFVGKTMVCSSGGFPQLQLLKLSFLYSVATWRIEEGAMRNLRQLEIVECRRLEIVPGGLWPVTRLRNLKLGYMPGDIEAKVRERQGENWYQIERILPL